MADTFHLQVATPESQLVDEDVSEAQLPGKDGYMTVLAGHAPLLSALGAGSLSYGAGGPQNVIVIAGGFVEVFDNHVRVLADSAELPQNVNVSAAQQDLQEASEALKRADTEEASNAALLAMQRAQTRIDAASANSSAH